MPYKQARKLTDRAVADFAKTYEGKPEDFRQSLAGEFGVSMRTVESRLPELVQQGVLSKQKAADGKTGVYQAAGQLGKRRTGVRLEPHFGKDQLMTEFHRHAVKDPDFAIELVEKYLPADLPESLVVINRCDMLREMMRGRPVPKVVEDPVTPEEKAHCKARLDAILSNLSCVEIHGMTETERDTKPVGDGRSVGAAFLAKCLADD